MIKDKIQVSKDFKDKARKAVLSIILFVVVYVIITIFALGLTILSVFGGIMLIVSVPGLITIVLGIGLASLGILVMIFLFKFIFKSSKTDRSNLKLITQKNEPELFKLIGEIVAEVGSPTPKKVYLSTDVNAAVFYDSNFWSMFFPIRKNLLIGMSLINTISKEELKAILSHEFGHFAQKEMKVGSFVNNVNKVLYNILYENESYDNLIRKWASISGYFSIFVLISVKIIQGIQWILSKMYEMINISYMGLSREMEFHADEIAANVTGYAPLKSSLLRMELSEHSFRTVLGYYENKIEKNIKSENIFKEQSFVFHFLAKKNGFPYHDNFPEISIEEINKFNKSKLVIKDQWASHPSLEERITRLEKTKIHNTNPDNNPAIEYFTDFESTQKELTNLIFKSVNFSETPKNNSLDNFIRDFKSEYQENTFDEIYNGYYDHKNPVPFNTKDEGKNEIKDSSIEELFSDEKINLVYTLIALQNDIEILNKIANRTFKIKSFDYNGKKYSQKESNALVHSLKSKFEELNEKIKSHDYRIFCYFQNLEATQSPTGKLKSLYDDFFNADKDYDKRFEVFSRLTQATQFINYVTPFEEIKRNFSTIKIIERQFKENINELLESERLKELITPHMRKDFEKYVGNDWKYFNQERYIDEHLHILFLAMDNYNYLLSKGFFLLKKELLNYQISLLNTTYQKA